MDQTGTNKCKECRYSSNDPITQVYINTSRSLLLCMIKDEFLIVVSVRKEQTLMQLNLTEDEVVPNAITCFPPSQIEPLPLIGVSTAYFATLNVKSNIRARDQEKNVTIQNRRQSQLLRSYLVLTLQLLVVYIAR